MCSKVSHWPYHHDVQMGALHCTPAEGDTEVTLKRDPKTDGLRRATQKAELKCRERKLVKNLQVHKSRELAGRCRGADYAEKASNADTERQVATREDK